MSKTDKSVSKIMLYVFISVLIISSIFAVIMFGPRPDTERSLFTLTLRHYTKGYEQLYYSDYALTIVQDLREIGIDAEDIAMDYATYLETVVADRNFDLAILEVEGETAPHLEQLFGEKASLNLFNFVNKLDNGLLSNLTKEISMELDYNTRISLYHDLQDHIMSNIVPMVPLFTPVRSYAFWDNLVGFSAELGLSNSLPYMSFSGIHEGQETTDILKIGVGRWFTLNPIRNTQNTEKLFLSLIMDKLIAVDSESKISSNGLVNYWEYLNDTTLLLRSRQNVIWQNDVDETFTDVPFTSNDTAFTLELMRNVASNINYGMYSWIKGYEVLNSTDIKIYIDGNAATTQNEPYAFALEDLSVYPLPDHYLNISSSIADIVLSNEWSEYSSNPIGTGKYQVNFEQTVSENYLELDKFMKWHETGVLPSTPVNLQFDKIMANTYVDTYTLGLDLEAGIVVDFGDFGKDPDSIMSTITSENILADYAKENSIIFLAFNLNNPNFGGELNYEPSTEEGISKALAMRKAIASIIDKVKMNGVLHNSIYNTTDSPVSMYHTDYYYSGVQKYPYNLQSAVDYINQAGYNVSLPQDTNTTESPLAFVYSVIVLSSEWSKYSSNPIGTGKFNVK